MQAWQFRYNFWRSSTKKNRKSLYRWYRCSLHIVMCSFSPHGGLVRGPIATSIFSFNFVQISMPTGFWGLALKPSVSIPIMLSVFLAKATVQGGLMLPPVSSWKLFYNLSVCFASCLVYATQVHNACSFHFISIVLLCAVIRVTTCLENREMSRNFTSVR